ncbi:kinesin-like protein KIF17 [Oratosquilla oratoria]|uniref:kinesin-like protein KIF17 n=1 Tax=Oratosquilla oratoria TaxID=337810 RepID=UPI003F76B566
MDKIRVAVRVRPFNRRERELASRSVVDMKNGVQCILQHPSALDKPDRDRRAILCRSVMASIL